MVLKLPHFGVRLEDWKYVVGPDEGVRELYDLSADPGELYDLAETRPEVAQRLDQRIARWLAGARKPPAEPPEPSPQDRDRLEKLGYVE